MNDKTIYTFIGCNDNKEIKYVRVENGGHNLRPTYPNMFSDIWNFLKDSKNLFLILSFIFN